MLGNMADLFGKMQDMQNQMKEVKEKLAQSKYSAESGGGMIKVTVNGMKQVVSIDYDKELVDPNDLEMLGDLTVAAVNKAMEKAEEDSKNALGDITKGMLPGGGIPGLDMSKFGL